MRWHIRLLFAPILAMALAAAPATQPSDDLAVAVEAIRAKHDVPALFAARVGVDGVEAIAAAGVRRTGTTQPVIADDRVHLGSCTKSMTALLIGRLIDGKKLSFDTTMADCFPAIAAKMNPTMGTVTVRQLLDHRAGLPANLAWGLIALAGGTLEAQRMRAVEEALFAKPAALPGTAFEYSNTGYVLLGAIIDVKAGGPWEAVIEKELFAPLGMTTAGFGPPQGDQPWGHVSLLGATVPSRLDNVVMLNPAGRVHCSMADWSRYIAECLRAHRGESTLISKATYRALTTPTAGSDYAGGWMILERGWAGGHALHHGGSNNTWLCVAWLAPEKGFAALAATNIAGLSAARACDETAIHLVKELDRK